MYKLIFLIVGAFLYFTTYPASAYIGPGAGAGVIAVVIGIIASVILAFVAILWFPIKRLFRNRKSNKKESAKKQSDENE